MTILTSIGKPLAQTESTFSKESCLELAEKSKAGSKQQARWKQRALDAESNDGTRLDAFLGHIHRGGNFKYLWRKTPGQRDSESRWYETKRPKAQAGKDTYFGVHPSRFIPETNAKGKKKPPAEVRSQLTSISAINSLYAEFDAKDFITNSDEEITGRADLFRSEHPNWTETRANQEAEKSLTQGKLQHRLTEFKKLAWLHVQATSPSPSVVVDSGGGYQCFWFLDEPFYTVKTENRELAGRLQSDWVLLMGGDPGAKDLARVLRLPGTTNTKYTPAQPVRFVHWDIDRTYTFEELEKHAEKAIKSSATLIAESSIGSASQTAKPTYTTPAANDREHKQRALDSLAPGRCDDYQTWLEVGMACHHDADTTFADWEHWSRQSSKFGDPGNETLMADKWQTFTSGKGITFKTVYDYAHIDTPGWHRVATEQPQTAEVTEMLPTPSATEGQSLSSRPDTICGVWVSYPDPGAPWRQKRYCLCCGNWRICEDCAQIKGEAIRNRVIDAMQAGPVYVVRTDKRHGTRIIRRLGKANCLRIPIADDQVVIFNTDKDDRIRGEGVEVLETNLPAVNDFAEFLKCAAVGKRITGALGKDADETIDVSEPDKAEVDTVLVNMVAHNCKDRELEKRIYQAAFERTKDQILSRAETTLTTVEFDLDLIVTEFKKLLRLRGFEITYQLHKHVKCDLVAYIDWKAYATKSQGHNAGGENDAKLPA